MNIKSFFNFSLSSEIQQKTIDYLVVNNNIKEKAQDYVYSLPIIK